jgi:hypothetical protein
MTDLDRLAQWQATMDMAIYKLEKRTGLRLAGLSPSQIAQKVKEWPIANKMRSQRSSSKRGNLDFLEFESDGMVSDKREGLLP